MKADKNIPIGRKKTRQISENQVSAQLIVERSDGEYWGRIKIKGNLIVESANTLEVLTKQMKKLIFEFEKVTVSDFDIAYDLTAFFETYSIISITDLARRANINPALMRQYASGIKFPSQDRVKDIEKAIKKVGKELSQIKLHKAEKRVA